MNKYSIHKSAIVETKIIGQNTRIHAFVHILKGAIVGENANICDFCFVENGVEIGNNVTIKCGVYLWDGIIVEDNVMIGPAAVFTNDLYPRSKNKKFKKLITRLKNGASIGANATILPGITIGRHAMIGAGTIVTKSIPDYALFYGSPAKIHGYICPCTHPIKLKKNIFNCDCGRKYKKLKSVVTQVL